LKKEEDVNATQVYVLDCRVYSLERALLMDSAENTSLLEPSFPDRKAFKELVHPTPSTELDQTSGSSTLSIAKHYFDGAIAKELLRWRNSGGIDAHINRFCDLVTCALDGIQIKRLNIKGDINFGQVFLYMQERALLAPLPDEGDKPRALDLVRNFLMSAFASRPLPEQEVIYLKKWHDPLELKASASELDAALASFLPAAENDRFICEFENAISRNPHSSPGVVLYARFVSYFAEREESNRGVTCNSDAGRLFEFVHTEDGTLTPAPKVKLPEKDTAVVKTAEQILQQFAAFVAAQTDIEEEDNDFIAPVNGPDPSEMFADIEDY
jgi:hypothetical protein